MADLSPVATTGSPLVWGKTVDDVSHQTIATANSLGSLVTDNSRLSVNGVLNANETAQYYSFTADDSGNKNTLLTGQTVNNTTGLRVQLLNAGGQVLADSKSGMGVASTNYASLQAGTYSLAKGTYYVKISRDGTVPASQPVDYVVEARMGKTYTNDYQTTEQKATPTYSSTPVASSAPSILTSSMLTGGAAAAVFASADLFGNILDGQAAANSASSSSS